MTIIVELDKERRNVLISFGVFSFSDNLGYLLPSPEAFGTGPEGHSILDSRELIHGVTCKPSYPHAR